MGVRWQVFTEYLAAEFMFVAIESKLQKLWDLAFRTEYFFVGCLSSCVVNTCTVSKGKFRCQERPIVSRVVQGVPPLNGKVLILGFNFAVGPS